MSYTVQFESVCPYYMAMGMSYDEFWHGDLDAVKMYRKAYKIHLDHINEEAYLHGLYVYEALCDVSPILRAFSKATKPEPFPSEPYDLHKAEKDAEAEKKKAEQEKADKKAKAMMELFMVNWNKKFKKTPERKEGEDGRDNSKRN